MAGPYGEHVLWLLPVSGMGEYSELIDPGFGFRDKSPGFSLSDR
jgi:hypothetical protein